MRYIESPSTDPALNLALEQYVFDSLTCHDEYFLLWQNRDSVIIGLHQNAAEEVNRAYIDRSGIPVLRRLSGGGAVFHDMGNLNFSFITAVADSGRLDLRSVCAPILEALKALGINAEAGERNDLMIDGNKFSGNARYIRNGRLMHHGTILFDSDLGKMTEALRASEDRIVSKSVKSVRARVTNLRNYLRNDMTVVEFKTFVRENIAAKRNTAACILTERDWDAVEKLRRERYACWDWNYGRSPEHRIDKRRRLPGFGDIRINLQVKDGKINELAISGVLLGSRLPSALCTVLLNTRMDRTALTEALSEVPPQEFSAGLSRDELIRLILE